MGGRIGGGRTGTLLLGDCPSRWEMPSRDARWQFRDQNKVSAVHVQSEVHVFKLAAPSLETLVRRTFLDRLCALPFKHVLPTTTSY